MEVLALIEGVEQPCYRYRLEAFTWSMAERGLYLKATALQTAILPRSAQFISLRHAEMVILQRKLLPRWQLALLRRAAKRLVYDVDDALFQRDSYHAKGAESRQRQRRFAATVRAADLVIAGNEYLKEQAAQYVEPERVCVIPTCVEPAWYVPATHSRRGAAVRLVWIGQRSTLPSLRAAEGHLAAAVERFPGLQLRVISDAAPALRGLRVAARRWSSVNEAAELVQGDIGVNWLPDDSWSRGKCGLRVLQYMAAGLPVIANPVGMNRAMVVHGETGLLASTPREWAEAISRLASDPPLRRRMGEAGRQRVARHYSVTAWGPRLAAAIDAVARDLQHCRSGVSGPSLGGKQHWPGTQRGAIDSHGQDG
jgi:glycosyltransferase involved in cell wall biosynthesis